MLNENSRNVSKLLSHAHQYLSLHYVFYFSVFLIADSPFTNVLSCVLHWDRVNAWVVYSMCWTVYIYVHWGCWVQLHNTEIKSMVCKNEKLTGLFDVQIDFLLQEISSCVVDSGFFSKNQNKNWNLNLNGKQEVFPFLVFGFPKNSWYFPTYQIISDT